VAKNIQSSNLYNLITGFLQKREFYSTTEKIWGTRQIKTHIRRKKSHGKNFLISTSVNDL